MSSDSKMELPKKPSYYNCYVYGCSNSTLNYHKAFFKIPSNLQRRNQWLKLMHREELIGSACLRARVCQEHFSPNLIKQAQVRTLLISNAYPQLLLPIPDKIEKETQTELGEITLCVCDLQINYQVQTLIKTSNYIVKSFTKLNDTFEGQSSSGSNELDAKGCASTCKRTKLIPLLKHAEDIIASVYDYLQAEYKKLKSSIGASCDLSPLANILERTAAATGVSENAVCAILEERKRAADEELEARGAKRAKLTHDYGDGDVSPTTDDESSCEAPDEEQDVVIKQEKDYEQPQDESQEPVEFEVETLKVEIKEEEDDKHMDPLQLHMSDESTKAWTTEGQTKTSKIKSNAQRCREYRERKKLQNTMVKNITVERSDECSGTDQLQAKRPKTNAERRKKHYEAQKLKKQKSKKIPKSAKQRNKEYYYRKKRAKALNNLNHHSDATDCAVQHLMSSSNSDRANISTATDITKSVDVVRKPPAIVVYPHSGSGVLRVMSIEPMTSFATVKNEPDDDPPNCDTLCDVEDESPTS